MRRYRGRFAPSPTGPLHLGSLVAATGSYLDAKKAEGEWLVRMEDVDEPRTVPGAADLILRTLAAFGMESDQPVIYQSRRKELYRSALEDLKRKGMVYPCGCTRKEILDWQVGFGPPSGQRYPGLCREGLAEGKQPRAWRFRVPQSVIQFEDRVMGPQAENLDETSGDFIVLRADGFFAYQLAVVVDDAEQGVTDVVRGADLLESTPRQIALRCALEVGWPRYLHLPVALNPAGEKLSKQTRAPAVDASDPAAELMRVLRFLGQHPPAGLEGCRVDEVWNWAIANWEPSQIPRFFGAQVL